MSMVRRASLPGANNNGSRREKLRTKTPAVNDLSKKFKNTPRGKRRLEFQPKQPLKDKKFYLDLHGYKKIPSLAARIRELGGKVEEFFNKDITYIITNRKDADTRLSPRSNSTPSPGMSVPSPFPINKSSSVKGSAWPSPFSADSPQSIETHQTVPKHDTRGRTLQKQATLMSTTKFGTSNVLTNAKAWGISVFHLDKVLEKLAEYGPSKAEKQPSIKELRCGKKELRVEIRKLQVPFIKVEDQSRHYQPLVKEFKEWPLPKFDTPVGTCPFDSPKRNKESELKRKNKEKDNHDTKKQTKKGYCECCCMHYDALDSHLKSDHHKAFAQSDSNYDSLDQLIKQGPSLSTFLDKLKQKYSKSESAEPISEYKVDNPFHTPTKEPVDLMNDAIDKEMNENIDENLIADIDKERANQEGVNENDVEDKKADDPHMGGSNGAKENSQAIETTAIEGSQGLSARKKTRSEDAVRNDTNTNPGTKLDTPNLPIEQKSSDPSKCAYSENDNHEFTVQYTKVSSQKATSPDQSGVSEEKIREHRENGIQENLPSQEPAAAVSFTSLKPHQGDDHDEDEGNRRVLRSQRKSNCSSDGTDGDKREVPKRVLRGQRKSSESTDHGRNEVPKQMFRGRRKSSESTSHDENDVPQRVLRRSQRKAISSSDSTDHGRNEVPKRFVRGQRTAISSSDSTDHERNEVPKRVVRGQRTAISSSDSTDHGRNEVPKRVVRGQRKTNCSSDSTETLTSIEGMTHSPAKRNFRSNKASSTDSLSEKGLARFKDDSKPPHFQQNEITKETFSEIQTNQEENDMNGHDLEVKENFSSPLSGLSGSKRRDPPVHGDLSSDDEDDHSDVSMKAKAGRHSIPKPMVPRSIWSKLPENNPKKENHDEIQNETLKEQDQTEEEQDLDGIAKVNDDGVAFTALFDSDDDDDKSFEGFDVPHFEGSKSSEQDFTYHIKRIVEYFTESQDDTLVNTTNEEVECHEERSGPTDGTEKKKKKKKQPHEIKIILSSRTDDSDDNVFEDEGGDDDEEDDEEDDDSDDEEEDSDHDDSSSTIADSTDGEDDELLSSSALCMDSFTYKRKSWNLEDDEIGFQQQPKRRRTTTDEDSSTYSAEDRETSGDQTDSDTESRSTTRASTRLSSSKEKSLDRKNGNVDMEDISMAKGNKETKRNTRSSSNTKGMSKNNRNIPEDTVIAKARKKARTSPRRAKYNKKISNQQSDDEDVTMEDVSQKESSKKTNRKTRSSSRNSNNSADDKENVPANVEGDSKKVGSKGTRCKNRATGLSNVEEKKVDSDNLGLEKDDANKETRRKTRFSKRASCTKESTLDDSKDIRENEVPRRRKTRVSKSKDLSSTEEVEVDHIKEHSVSDDPCPKRITRSQGETDGDLKKRNDRQTKKNPNIISEKKGNSKQKAADNEVSSSKPKANDVATNDSLSSVLGDISCTSDSSFFKGLPQDIIDYLSVHMSIEERVKLRTRNKMNPESQPVRQNTNEKRKEEDPKGKSDLQIAIVDSKRASSKNDEVKTESTNMAESGNNPRLRSHSLNQKVENSKNLTKSRSVGSSSVASPPPRKSFSSASSSRDTSPIATPIRAHKHWIFDPGHFSSSTPQPLRKVKTRTSPKTENKLLTKGAMRNANKCLVAGDMYEFVVEDVFAFDD